jgi:hypothetical protein
VLQAVVVLVTIDGVRWQEIANGTDSNRARPLGLPVSTAEALTPNLHALLRRGAAILGPTAECPGIAASGPGFLSLPGYAEIITGRSDTGCHDNTCAGLRHRTLLDDFAQREGASQGDVAMLTSWPDLQRLVRSDSENIDVSAGRHAGATRAAFLRAPAERALLDQGARREPFPGHGDYRPDSATARLALLHIATRRPAFTWLGLGDPDEYAHRNDYAGYLTSLKHADDVIGAVTSLLDDMVRAGHRTALFVTADHGRADNFKDHGPEFAESGRVWLVAAGTEIPSRGLAACDNLLHLADIAPTIRVIASLDGAPGPTAGKPIAAFEDRPAPDPLVNDHAITARVGTPSRRIW